MRLSPNGRRFIYVAGKGLRPARPMVTLRLEDGVDVALAPGHSPRWFASEAVVFGNQEDGPLLSAVGGGWAVDRRPTALPSGNSVAAAQGRIAVHRTDPRRILSNWRTAPILGATDPVLSDDGEWLAYLLPDQPPGLATLVVERADGEGEPRILATGAIQKPRFGGRTLVWEAGNGVMGGCADVGNPHVDPVTFRLPSAWRCFEPVPVWVPNGSALLVLFLADRGDLAFVTLAEWGSLAAGAPTGYALGSSTGSGYEHDARGVDGGPTVRAVFLNPMGAPEEATIDVRSPRQVLVPPAPPVKPPTPPDIPWTPDPTRTVDMLEFHKAASTAYVDNGDGTGQLWMHKSQERPDWGENRDHDAHWIGFVEDRSTGTRMVTLPEPRPKKDPWTNTTRDRWSPEQIVAWNEAHTDRPVGDYRTLPLAGYSWIGNRPFMPRHVTGRADLIFRARYDWWDEPHRNPVAGAVPPRGRWELHPPIRIHIGVETGYARFNGHDVYAISRYGRPLDEMGPNDEVEWSLWGPHGWIGFIVFDQAGRENVAARRIAPPEQRASPLNGVFVPARFQPTYPIFDPAREQPAPDPKPDPKPMPNTFTLAEIDAVLDRVADDPEHRGARQRFRDEVCLPRDRAASMVTEEGQPGFAGDLVTGGASMYFERGFARDRYKALFRGAASIDASVAGLIGAARDYDRAVDKPAPEPDPGQPPPAQAIAGRLRVERGRLRNDAGWFQLQGISEFDAIHLARTGQRGEVTRRFRRAARCGRNVVRVLGMAKNLFDLHPGQAGYDDAFDFVLELAASLGMYVLYTAGADLQLVMSQADFARFLEGQARRRRDDPRIVWTIVNEARKNGYAEADDPALLALADVLADALGHRDFGISDPLDGDDEHATAGMLRRFEAIARRSSLLLLHGSRKDEPGRVRWVEHLKGLRDVVDEMMKRTGRDLFGIHEEPMGAAAAWDNERRDHRPAAHVAGACTAAVLGLGYVYHYIAAQSDAVPGLAEAAIAARIPASPEFRYTNANLGGSWVGPVGAWSKIRPAHDGAQAWAVGVGLTPGPLNVQDGWRVVETAVIESEGVHCHVWRGERA